MGYIVSDADIPNLPVKVKVCQDCQGSGGQKVIWHYTPDKVRSETVFGNTCDSCLGTGKQESPILHLETRRESFAIYTDYGAERIEVNYEDLPLLEIYVRYLRKRVDTDGH